MAGVPENLWRIRSGNYRTIYTVEDEIKIVEIRSVGDRKDVYR
jgi:mRNA interferase RelE/StbE